MALPDSSPESSEASNPLPDGRGSDRNARASEGAVHESGVAETLISLIVAFVIAMSFRGFVLEGFVIPTGSMAPTLLGEHMLIRSPETGYLYEADTGERFLGRITDEHSFAAIDPMLGEDVEVATLSGREVREASRPGDRVLVHKWPYSLFDPDRWDVIVFKNPTMSRENYIKRLIGLPGEEIWLADGDVFARDAAHPEAPFRVQRKPEHVQRAVWQPVHDTAFGVSGDRTGEGTGTTTSPADAAWIGAIGDAGGAGSSGAATARIEGPAPTILEWNARRRGLDDRNPYNLFDFRGLPFPVSDLRVRGAITAEEAGLTTILRLRARAHEFEFVLDGAEAIVRLRPIAMGESDAAPPPASETGWRMEHRAKAPVFRPGRVADVEFWHVDQTMSIFVNGDLVVEMEYDWDAAERLLHATGRDVEELLSESRSANPWVREARASAPTLEWEFSGADAVIHRIRVDRDLYYQPDTLNDGTPAMATHPRRTASLGPDHFFMCGDNSAASHDGRKWGDPDEIVAAQIDPTPFVVHRRLLVGRAWSVYFPAPFSLTEGGARFIPDFGRVRFVR